MSRQTPGRQSTGVIIRKITMNNEPQLASYTHRSVQKHSRAQAFPSPDQQLASRSFIPEQASAFTGFGLRFTA